MTLDCGGWLNAIRKFWGENRRTRNRDFTAGYCTHLLTDWEYDRCIWTPYREKMVRGAESNKVYEDEQYRNEAYGFDQWLYQADKDSEKIWQLLEQGHVYRVEGCILEKDLARQKESLLKEQFIGKTVYNVSGYQICTREIMENFIEGCVKRILQEMVIK